MKIKRHVNVPRTEREAEMEQVEEDDVRSDTPSRLNGNGADLPRDFYCVHYGRSSTSISLVMHPLI